jgi:hypothetical protein
MTLDQLQAIAVDAEKIAPGDWWQDEGHVYCGPYTYDFSKRQHVALTSAAPTTYGSDDITRARHIAAFDPARALALIALAQAVDKLTIGAAILVMLEDAGRAFKPDVLALLEIREALEALKALEAR